jgi:hypothetical protein
MNATSGTATISSPIASNSICARLWGGRRPGWAVTWPGEMMTQRINPKAAVMLVFLLSAPAARAQNQTPVIFDESDLVVGTPRLETRFLFAEGFWSDGDKSLAANSVVIHCYKRFGFCEDAEALVGGVVELSSYDILRWDSHELVAVDSSPICIVTTLRFDLVAKKVSISSVQKTDKLASKDPLCKDLGAPPPAFLGGTQDKTNQLLGRKP